MFDHEPINIPPIIEDLTPQDMSAHTPNRSIFLLSQPLMTERLGVEIVYFERTVMHVFLQSGRQGRQKHGVVVDEVLAAVDVGEKSDFLACGRTGFRVDFLQWDVQDVAGDDVEMPGVPVHRGGEVGDVESEMAQLCVWEEERELVKSKKKGERGREGTKKDTHIPCALQPDQARIFENSSHAVYPSRR